MEFIMQSKMNNKILENELLSIDLKKRYSNGSITKKNKEIKNRYCFGCTQLKNDLIKGYCTSCKSKRDKNEGRRLEDSIKI